MKLPLSCTAKRTYEFLQAHTRPQSVMLILCAARILCSFLHLQLSSVSMFHPVLHVAPVCSRAGLPTTVQTRRPTESPPRPASHHSTNTVSLANDICQGAVDRPYLTPVPRRRSPAGVHMDVHFAPRCACLLGLAMWPSLSPSPRPPCALFTLICAH